jgi:hypothetical protein
MMSRRSMLALGAAGAAAGWTAPALMRGAADRASIRGVPDGEGSSRNGVVHLNGTTTTPFAKSHAESLAKAVPGVTQVIDDIGTQK